MRLALVCPRTGAFIMVSVLTMAAYDRVQKRPVSSPFVGIVAYDPIGRKVWSERDVSRCERNERFFKREDEARSFAADIARTLQTATSLGRLTLLQGQDYQTWHEAKFCVA
jgi:hypothetical protein